MSAIHKKVLKIENLRERRAYLTNQRNKFSKEISDLNLTIGYQVNELEALVTKEYGRK